MIKSRYTVIIAVVVSVLIAFPLGYLSRGPPVPPVETILIGISPYYVGDDWWRVELLGAKCYAEDHGYGIVVLDPNASVETQIKDIRYMVDSVGVNVLIIAPTELETPVAAIEYAISQGVPVITIDQFADTDKISIAISAGLARAGKEATEALIDMMKKDGVELKGTVFIVTGPLGASWSSTLTDAEKSVLSEYPDLTVQVFVCPNWGADEGIDHIVNGVLGFGKPLAVIGNNTTTGIGAIEGLKRAEIAVPTGQEGHVYTVCFDGADSAMGPGGYMEQRIQDINSTAPSVHFISLAQYFANLIFENGEDALPSVGTTLISDLTKPDGPLPDGKWNLVLERGCMEYKGENPWKNAAAWAPVTIENNYGHRWLKTSFMITTYETLDDYTGFAKLGRSWLE